MLKTAAITVSLGEDLIIFPADKSGVGYLFKKGIIPDKVLIEPTKAIKELQPPARVKLAWSEENQNLVPVSIDGKGIDGKLASRVTRELSKQMRDFTSLRDFFPTSQVEDFAVVAMLRTSATTGVTPEQARAMAAQVVSHQLVSESISALALMGFTPNKKALDAKNPMRDVAMGSGLVSEESPTVDTESETI